MKTDFCIVGSGIAGMSLAIRLSELGKVILVSKSDLISGSTPLAQGGVAGVVQKNDDARRFSDSFLSHFEDTMNAGRNENNSEAVKILVESAPQVLDDLEKWGIHFHQDRHLEAGHSHHRIFNTGDTTGKTIAEGLAKKVQEISETGKIIILENTVFTHLLPPSPLGRYSPIMDSLDVWAKAGAGGEGCLLGKGVFSHFFNTKTQKNITIQSQKIFLATGGYSSLFSHCTTPEENIGDGISVFLQAGGKTKDLHFIQFHPTVLNLPRSPQLLLSEALRGSGAKIVFQDGTELCDPLFPRDIVSQKIFDAENSEKNPQKIFLDCRNIQNFPEKFISIHHALTTEFSLDTTTDLLPISPAAHYCMGGIETDIWGKTNLKNVFALGECANAGVHGKNRLASNSLLEGLVFANQIFTYIKNNKNSPENSPEKTPENISQNFSHIFSEKNEKYIISSDEDSIISEKIRETCSKFLGISRNKKGIEQGKKELQNIGITKKTGTREKNMNILGEAIFDDMMRVYSSSISS